MEIRQLKSFKTIVELGSFSRAAEQLGYAQSTITAHIQEIEKEIGKPLFDRLGKKIVLTEIGKNLIPYAIEMLDLYAKVLVLGEDTEVPSGSIVIGAPESLTVYRLPSIIHEYKNLYPKVDIALKSDDCLALMEQVKSGELDLAFLLQPERQDKDLHFHQLLEEKMVIILPMDHPLPSSDSFSTPEIKQFFEEDTIIYTEQGCPYRHFFEAFLSNDQAVPSKSLEFWSVEAIKQCVRCGLGISLLPLMTVRSELEEGKLKAIPWDPRNGSVSTTLIYHKNKYLTPALEKFISLVKDKAQNWQ